MGNVLKANGHSRRSVESVCSTMLGDGR